MGEALGGLSGAATPPGVVEPATGAGPGSLWMPWAQWVLAVVPYGDALATNKEPLLTDRGLRVFLLLKESGYTLHKIRRLRLLARSTLLARHRSRDRARGAAGAA